MASAYLYDAEGHDHEVDLDTAVFKGVGKSQLLWLDVERNDRPGLKTCAKLLNLESEALASITHPPKPARLDRFKAHFQFSLPLPPDIDGKLGPHIDFLVADKWLLTVRDANVDYLVQFRDQDKAETLTGDLTPAALAASLLDWHLESFHQALARVEAAVDKLDERVLGVGIDRPPLSALAELRGQVSSLRVAVGEHRAIIYGLLRADFSEITETHDEELYRALERRFDRLTDTVDRARELVIGSFELYATRTAQDTNRLVQTLTLITVVVGVIGAIAGIFGMNFDTPISHEGTVGFLIVTGLMLLIGVAAGIAAKWRKWI